MVFILTTKDEEYISKKYGIDNYKFFDVFKLRNEFADMNEGIPLKYVNVHLNQYVSKRLKNGLKSFKNDYFFYRIEEMNVNNVTNIRRFVLDNYGHKIKQFNGIGGVCELNENIECIFDNYLTNTLTLPTES